MRIETSLLQRSDESTSERKTNVQDGARVDLNGIRFWITDQRHFFTKEF